MLKAWALARETRSLPTRFNIQLYLAHTRSCFSSLQDVARHQPKALVATIESRQWCGELHLGRFGAHMLLLKVRQECVAPNSFMVRVTSYFYGLPSTRTVRFFLCVCSRFFFPEKKCRW